MGRTNGWNVRGLNWSIGYGRRACDTHKEGMKENWGIYRDGSHIHYYEALKRPQNVTESYEKCGDKD